MHSGFTYRFIYPLPFLLRLGLSLSVGWARAAALSHTPSQSLVPRWAALASRWRGGRDHFGESTGMIVTPQAEKTSCFFETVVECRPCQLCSMFTSPRSCVLLGENPHLRSGWGFLFDKMEQGVPVAAWKQNGRCIGELGSWLETGCSVSRRTALASCAVGGDGLSLPLPKRRLKPTTIFSRVMSLRWCYHHQRHCKIVRPTPS